ncbi:unnamed protein product [Prorocentrum cordatum]|uniref:Uncharacterized protein n=1 Tax=Prorocentrum cordatum TaxID=2364126 RepID=A0ABN9Q1R1_9DINO|nr:unnamed protein product [Polarella glacialis]
MVALTRRRPGLSGIAHSRAKLKSFHTTRDCKNHWMPPPLSSSWPAPYLSTDAQPSGKKAARSGSGFLRTDSERGMKMKDQKTRGMNSLKKTALKASALGGCLDRSPLMKQYNFTTAGNMLTNSVASRTSWGQPSEYHSVESSMCVNTTNICNMHRELSSSTIRCPFSRPDVGTASTLLLSRHVPTAVSATITKQIKSVIQLQL